MASVTNLNTGGTVQSKIFNDSLSASCSYGNVREKVITGSIPSNSSVQLPDICKIKPPDTVMLEMYLTGFATDGTNSSQIITLYISANQLTNGGAVTISPNTNDVLINFNNGVVSVTPLILITFVVDPTNNSVIAVLSTLAGSQQRPCRFTLTCRQYSSIPY